MSLFERVLDWLRSDGMEQPEIADAASDGAGDLELRAATAVLLLEAAYGDSDYAWSEHRVIVEGLRRGFGLDRRQVHQLLGQAEEIRPPVLSLADVTDVLRDRLGPEQRQAVLGLLWKVISADGIDEPWEEAFAAHVAGALEIPRDRQSEARRRASS